MADVVGLIASVLQLVDAVAKGRRYIQDFRDAPKDQQRLLLEVQNLDTLLKALDTRVKKNYGALRSSGMQEVEGSLIHLKGMMERLTKKLDPKGIAHISSRLTWSLWGKEDVQEALDAIERFKSLVNAWLGVDVWDSAQDISQSVKHISLDQKQYYDHTVSALKNVVDAQGAGHNYIARSLRDVTRNQEQYHALSERDKIIEWFSPLNFFQRQVDVSSTRQSGTGDWFLQNDLVQDWKSGIGKRLWCRGIPGAGKTVLASILVNDLRTTLEGPNTGVAVIYLNHKESDAQSPASILAGIWRQLVFRKSISPTMNHLYDTHREQRTRPSLEETRSVLCSTVTELSRVFIIVDALDEYPAEKRETLVNCLLTLEPTVNLMLTSRPHIDVEGLIPDDLRILEVRANEDDIRRYTDAQIAKSLRLSKQIKNCPDLRAEIEKKIVLRCDGMFLLAKLNIDSLVTKHTVKAVRDALKNIPGDLNSTYDDAMERISRQSEEDRNLARRTLFWISNAHMIFHISELIEALAIEPGSIDLDPENKLDTDVILSVCAGLVVISREDDLVRLIHHTAQDYLDRIQDTEFPNVQSEIAGACITYLSFPKFARNHDLENLLDENPLLEYALLFCLIHARGQPEHCIEDDILRFLTHLAVDCENMWQNMHSVHTNLPQTRLGIAAYFGMLEVVKLLIEQDGFDIHALHGATINGHTQIVRLLMKTRGYREHIELWKASQMVNHLAHVCEPDVRCRDIPALQVASLEGDEDRVYSLLASGADINEEAPPYGTALQAASASGHYPVVCILLANGADTNSRSGMYYTPLRAASVAGHTDIVHLLLDNGAEINELALPASSLGDEYLLSIPRRTSQKKALLIGINDAHDDVHRIRDLLLDMYHYTISDITILVDDGIERHVQPTRGNILAAISELVQDVKVGDRLYFHYAGHLSREDDMSECPITSDGLTITHKEIHGALFRPLPSGSHLVAVLDTCHSGTLLDLKHFKCNRVYVPWTRRRSEEIWKGIVRRNTGPTTVLQSTSPGYNTPTSTLHRARPLGSSIGLGVVASTSTPIPKPESVARLRTGNGPLARLRTLSLSIVSAAKNRKPIKLTWTFPDEDPMMRCESPVVEDRFPCDGWCRNIEGPSTGTEQMYRVDADVVLLASTKDSQDVWAAENVSMTSLLVDLLRADPNQPLKDVLIRISHTTYSLATSKVYKKQHKNYADKLIWKIKQLTVGEQMATLKQKFGAVHQDGGYGTDNLLSPELASSRPLDMNRPWRM